VDKDIQQAVEVLRQGGTILYPTDTIWGIGCDATDEKAVRRVYEIKKREDKEGMLVLLDSKDFLPTYAEVPDIAWELIEVAKHPLTIIYPGARNLAPGLLGSDGCINFCQYKRGCRSTYIRRNKQGNY
jgi:L-threonylcarbamoyladenylate synthase